MCGYAAGGSMKKHGPPPCGMNRVGNRLMAVTGELSGGPEPSRETRERQASAGPVLEFDVMLRVDADGRSRGAGRLRTAGPHVRRQIVEAVVQQAACGLSGRRHGRTARS